MRSFLSVVNISVIAIAGRYFMEMGNGRENEKRNKKVRKVSEKEEDKGVWDYFRHLKKRTIVVIAIIIIGL